MAAALHGESHVDWYSIAPAVGLRLQGVKSLGRNESATAIDGGAFIDGGEPVEGVIYQTPPRRISLFFPDKKPSDPEIAARRFAPEQRIVPSQTGGGYAIVFNIGDVECAVLVSEPEGVIDGVTASEAGPGHGAEARSRSSS